MAELKKYSGGCHCGKVRYEVQADLTAPVTACNCSMCGRMGWLLTFVPASNFELQSGSDVLKDYQFNKKHIHHVFCTNCGIHSFSHGKSPDGKEMFSVNARCLDDVDPSTLTVNHFDGKSR